MFKTNAEAFEKGWDLGTEYAFGKMLYQLEGSVTMYAKILQKMRNGELTTIAEAIDALELLVKHHQGYLAKLRETTNPLGDIVAAVAKINPEIAKGLKSKPPWSG